LIIGDIRITLDLEERPLGQPIVSPERTKCAEGLAIDLHETKALHWVELTVIVLPVESAVYPDPTCRAVIPAIPAHDIREVPVEIYTWQHNGVHFPGLRRSGQAHQNVTLMDRRWGERRDTTDANGLRKLAPFVIVHDHVTLFARSQAGSFAPPIHFLPSKVALAACYTIGAYGDSDPRRTAQR